MSGPGRREGRAGHPRPRTRAGAGRLGSGAEAHCGPPGRGRAAPSSGPRGRERPPRGPAGPAGAQDPCSRATLPAPTPARPLPPRAPGPPASGQAPGGHPALRGGSPRDASRKPVGPGGGDAGAEGTPAGAPRRPTLALAAEGALGDPRVLGASPGDQRARAWLRVAWAPGGGPRRRWGGGSVCRSRSHDPRSLGKLRVACDPAAPRGTGAHGAFTTERTAFPERERGCPTRAAGRLGGMGGARAERTWAPPGTPPRALGSRAPPAQQNSRLSGALAHPAPGSGPRSRQSPQGRTVTVTLPGPGPPGWSPEPGLLRLAGHRRLAGRWVVLTTRTPPGPAPRLPPPARSPARPRPARTCAVAATPGAAGDSRGRTGAARPRPPAAARGAGSRQRGARAESGSPPGAGSASPPPVLQGYKDQGQGSPREHLFSVWLGFQLTPTLLWGSEGLYSTGRLQAPPQGHPFRVSRLPPCHCEAPTGSLCPHRPLQPCHSRAR